MTSSLRCPDRVVELNHQANNAMSALVRDNLSEGWLLWLARVQPMNILA